MRGRLRSLAFDRRSPPPKGRRAPRARQAGGGLAWMSELRTVDPSLGGFVLQRLSPGSEGLVLGPVGSHGPDSASFEDGARVSPARMRPSSRARCTGRREFIKHGLASARPWTHENPGLSTTRPFHSVPERQKDRDWGARNLSKPFFFETIDRRAADRSRFAPISGGRRSRPCKPSSGRGRSSHCARSGPLLRRASGHQALAVRWRQRSSDLGLR